jgi:antitoxin Phd
MSKQKQKVSFKKRARSEAPAEPPAARWQLQTAKARFSEVFRRARSEGPQWITRQDREAVVMLPAEEFERLTGRAKQPRSLARFFAESPLAKVALDLERTPDYGRVVDL